MIVLFDVRTLFFVGAAACFVCGAMLWLTRRLHGPSQSALAWSAAAQAGFGTAMLLISLRGIVPDALSYVVANTLGPAASVLMYEGVRRLTQARPMPALVAVSVVALAALQAWLGPTADAHTVRLLITSVVQGGFVGACIPLLRRRRGIDPGAPLGWAIAFAIVFTVAHVLRIGYTLAVGAGVAPMVYAMILIGFVNGRIAAELWALATVDTLTGVRTRRSFIEEARRTLLALSGSGADGAPAQRPADAVLLMLDLDRFKQVNDRFGHLGGDRVLVRFAERLRELAPPGAVFGRYGGEEFCLLLPGATPGAGQAFAERVCEAIRGTAFRIGDPDPVITVSIGLAGAPDGTTLEELMLAADRRLYLAKSWGRDRVVSSDRAPTREESERVARSVVPV
jgi:diguanylate cyclase (GGDEF)-like protein